MAVTLEHNGTRAQHSFAIRGAHAGAAAGCQNWLARARGLSTRSDPSGWSPRASNGRIVSANSKSFSGSKVHRGSYPRAQWHTGTAFIRNARGARRGSGWLSKIGWLAPEGLVHARGSERLESSARINGRIVSANSKSLAGPKVPRGKHPRTQWLTGTAFIRSARGAHAGAAAGCQIGWLAPARLVHARGSERLEPSRASKWTDCFC